MQDIQDTVFIASHLKSNQGNKTNKLKLYFNFAVKSSYYIAPSNSNIMTLFEWSIHVYFLHYSIFFLH